MNKKLLLIILVVVLMAGGGGGYFFFSKGASAKQTEKKVETEKSSTTLELPEFVVNLQDKLRSHYLKAIVVLEISGGGESEKLKELTPYLRDVVITTLSKQEYDVLLTEQGKSELKRELLVRVQKVADKADAKVSSVLFTSFVMD